MLIIRNFEKKYGDIPVISIPLLELKPGFHWFKGENGSGKSSFFRSIAGIIPCTGKVCFDDGVCLHEHPVRFRERINISEAEPVYPGFLSGKDIFHFVAKARNATTIQQERLLDIFGVGRFFSKPCDTYSSGMLKRLSLAISFLGMPHVIVFDEPMITLDSAARDILISEINNALASQSITILMSSHEQVMDERLQVDKTYTIKNQTIPLN